jgi:D-3-phosphoglycerate dehydrogenase
MSKNLKVLIAGDLFMKPGAFIKALKDQFESLDYQLQFRTIQYPYPLEDFPLVDHPLPSQTGGCWDELEFHDEKIGSASQISEYYGPLDRLVPEVEREDILIVHLAPVTRQVLERALRLRLIVCCRSGPKNIDLAVATERGIPVLFTPGRHAVAVAEYTVGLLLSHTRYIARGHAHLVQGIWKVGAYRDDYVGPQLCGRTVGIVGLGNIGQHVAALLSGFQTRTCAFDPYAADEIFADLGVKRLPLDRLLRQADFVLLTARLTRESAGMIGDRELGLMKSTAYLVNTARGGLVDYQALRRALEEHRIAGAALDVFDVEPPTRDEMLLRLPNVTVTPHIAGASVDVLQNAASMASADVRRFVQGQQPLHCSNPETLARRGIRPEGPSL